MELLTTIVLIAHLLCVNVAAGGPIVCVWLEWRGDGVARKAARYLGHLALCTLLAGGLLGIVVGWLKWTPEYGGLWTGPLAYKLHWGGAELAFSLGLAIAYWVLVRGRGGHTPWSRVGRGAIALVNGTNLLYHFPTLFIVAGKLHEAGQTSGSSLRGAAFRQLAGAGETPALAMHVALASVAMAGIMLLGLALRWLRHDEEPADAAQVATWGGRWALVASLLQLPVGLWTLAVLPAGDQSLLMGSDGLATVLFFASMLSALWLLRELASVALGETTRPVMMRAMSAMLIVVALMTAMQQQTRARTSNSQGASAWRQKS
jgi:hypothetical protein